MGKFFKFITSLVVTLSFLFIPVLVYATETNFTISILDRPEYTVSLSTEPDGVGVLGGAGVYDREETVTVEVVSTNPGYTFLHWTEDGNIVAYGEVYSFVLMDDRDLVAHFQPDQHTVTVSADPSAGGNVTGAGVYDHDSGVTVETGVNPGYTFINWTEGVNVVSTNLVYTFNITNSRDLVANFEINEYTINVTADPSAGGIATGGGVYTYGTNITVSADASTGYEFVEWRVGSNRVSTSSTYSFNVTSDRNLRAIFRLRTYTISASVSGSGSVSGTGNYTHGSQVTLNASSNVGHTFLEWREGGNRVSGNAAYNFTATRNRNLTAVFERNAYTINLSTEGNGSVSGAGTYLHGQSVSISATPSSGNHFVRWREGNQEVSRSSSFNFTATRNRNLVAVFAVTTTTPPPPSVTTYIIDATAGDNGSIEPEGNVSVNQGDDRSFLMVPDSGYGIFDVFVDSESQGRVSEYSFNDVSENHTIHVDFARIILIHVEDGDGGRWALSRRYLDNLMSGDEVIVRMNDIEVFSGYAFERLLIIEEGGTSMSIRSNNLPYNYVVGRRDATFRFEFSSVEPDPLRVDESLERDDDVGFIPRTTSRLTEAVITSPSSTVQAIRNLDMDDTVAQTSSAVVGAAVLPMTLLTFLSSQFGVYYYMLQFLLNLLGVLGIRKKGQPYAVVYNSITKEPINRAIIRVYNRDGKMVHTDVSNVYGVFSRELSDGEYRIEAFARGFTTPSNVVVGHTDLPYENIYREGFITVNKDRPMRYAIAMDPLEFSRLKYAKAILINRLTNYVTVFQKLLVILGFGLSVFVYLRVPTVFNFVILSIYVPLLFLTFISFFAREKSYGRVQVEGGDLDSTEVILGLRELEFETLVDKRICNAAGKYRFLVSSGKYRLEVLNPGYVLSKEHVFEGVKNKPLVINTNLVIKKEN